MGVWKPWSAPDIHTCSRVDWKQVKCWDLEQSKASLKCGRCEPQNPHQPQTTTSMRSTTPNYHSHLSGVYSIALHPTLDLLMTGGRDSVCRVWDMRTKVQVHCLSGHENVCSILTQPVDPQV